MDKNIMAFIIVVVLVLVGFVGWILLRGNNSKTNTNTETETKISSLGNTENKIVEETSDSEKVSSNKSAVIYFSETGNTEQVAKKIGEVTNADIIEKEESKMYIKINDKILTATLEDNSSVKALVEKLKENNITINMSDYSNFEKVGELGFDLPRNDKQISTNFGDLILYQGNNFVIYYDKNNWNFTKLGHIDNISQEELKQILGKDNVTVTLSLEK